MVSLSGLHARRPVIHCGNGDCSDYGTGSESDTLSNVPSDIADRGTSTIRETDEESVLAGCHTKSHNSHLKHPNDIKLK